MGRFERISGRDSGNHLSDGEAEFILNGLNKAFEPGTKWYLATPEYLDELDRRWEARHKQMEFEKAKSADNSKVE